MENIKLFSIGNGNLSSLGNVGQKGQTEAEEQTSSAAAQGNKQAQVSADKYFEAFNIIGMQNMHQVKSNNEVNFEAMVAKAHETLGEDRVNDIQAGMDKFMAGVEETGNVVAGELPNVSEAVKNQIAAEMFARG